MIFDSVYDIYRGVITYIRVVDGHFTPRERIKMMSTGATHELLEIGVISPEPKPTEGLGVGEVGYLITGVKDVRQSRVGDTVTDAGEAGQAKSLGGYRDPKPMVYSGLYPIDGSDYPLLRDALDRLRLNDAALVYEPESSAALGFGFRCGFLGLLHLEITRDRLEREFGLDLISTAPNVVYRVDRSRTARSTSSPTRPTGRPARRSPRSTSRSSRRRSSRRASTSARSWSCARSGAARWRDGLPVRDAGRAALHAAARRDHLRLLRPAEVAHPRLRQPRLRARRRAGVRPGQGRHPAAGRAGRRVLGDRPQGQGLRLRHVDDRASCASSSRGSSSRCRSRPRSGRG